MEERKIYRGNFINFMTGQVDHTLARSNQYTLRIIENGVEYFYKIIDDIPHYIDARSCEQEKLIPSVLTDWDFLKRSVKVHHIFSLYPDALDPLVKEKCDPQKDLTHLYDWADQFLNLLPRDVVIRIYEEIGEKFQKVKHMKTYHINIEDYSINRRCQIDEFQIDSDWYLYLCRESIFKGELSKYFYYNLKQSHVVRKEKEEFKKTTRRLASEFHIPAKIVSAILKLCNRDIALCEEILKDIKSTREKLSGSELDYLDTIYKEYLENDDYFYKELGFSHFINDWRKISASFKFFSKNMKKDLSDFMLGL